MRVELHTACAVPVECLPAERCSSWVISRAYSDMPDHVPRKVAMLHRSEARAKLEKILARAFPNHEDRSDTQSDYFDYCWSFHC